MGSLRGGRGSRSHVNQQLWVRSLLVTLVAAGVGVACGDDGDPFGSEANPTGGEPSAGSPSRSGASAGAAAGLGGASEGGGGTGPGALGGEAGQGGARELPRGGAGGEGGAEPAVIPPRLHCPGEGGAGGAQGDLVVGGAGGSDGDNYTRTDLGEHTSAVAINALDQVLVNADCNAFVVDGNDVTQIVVPGRPRCTSGIDLSDVGTIVGTASFAKVGEEEDLRAFLWKDGDVTMLPVAGLGEPFMINNLEQLLLRGDNGTVLWDGEVVPLMVEGLPARPYFINNAGHLLASTSSGPWLIQGTKVTKVPLNSAEPQQALSDTGLVVGIHDQVVAMWDGATITKFDVVTEGHPDEVTDEEDDDGKVVVRAVNGLGTFVGDYPIYNAEETRPFVFSDGRTTRLAAGGTAVDVNASGVVVGNRWTFSPGPGGINGGQIKHPHGGAVWSRGCFSSCCASQ